MFNIIIYFLLVAACLPFKPSTAPSPVTPVGSSGSKKRRVPPSNLGARCSAKNTKVEFKKAPEKSPENASDDKVVSSSCEVDSSNSVSCSTSSKALPSRSSLDYFVHTTQKLEVTTSSMDGDLVDLTTEDESASEAVPLTSTCVPAGMDAADVMPAAVSDNHGMKVLVPDAAEPEMKTVTHVEKPAEMKKDGGGTERDGCVMDTEVAQVQRSWNEDAEKPACSGGGNSNCAVDNGNAESSAGTLQMPDCQQSAHEVDCSVDTQVVVNDEQATGNAVVQVGQSPVDVSSSDADDEADMAESSICDNVDNEDEKLSQTAAVVVKKLDNENVQAADESGKSEVSTTSANVNDVKKVTGHSNQKPQVR